MRVQIEKLLFWAAGQLSGGRFGCQYKIYERASRVNRGARLVNAHQELGQGMRLSNVSTLNRDDLSDEQEGKGKRDEEDIAVE